MTDNHRPMVVVGATAIALLASCSAPSPSPRIPAAFIEGQTYAVMIATEQFSDPLANDYFPLQPGLVWVFEGDDERVEVKVTTETKVIMGVTTHVISDQVFVDGELQEDTVDWYAADNFGNVWYFGEQTAEYENGQVTSTEGSWEAGVDGALPGIIMLAHPEVGDTYRQEFYSGQAEDVAKVYAVEQSVTVPKDSYELVIVTDDWSLLTPDVHERKWYAPNVGVVFEETISGGSGTLSLIDLTRP